MLYYFLAKNTRIFLTMPSAMKTRKQNKKKPLKIKFYSKMVSILTKRLNKNIFHCFNIVKFFVYYVVGFANMAPKIACQPK